MTRSPVSRTARTALLLALLAAMWTAPAAAEEIACPRAIFSPVLDGRLDDWPRLPQAIAADPEDWRPSAAEFADYGGPADVSWEVRTAWDNQTLYVGLETRDNNLVRVQSAAEIDRGDSVVLAVSPAGAEQVNQFVIALLRSASLVWQAEPAESAGEVRTIGRALWARQEPDGGSRVTYELSIPWAELREIRPIPGAELTLTVSACDDDGAGLKGCLERSLPLKLSAAGMAGIEQPPQVHAAPSLSPAFAAPRFARFDERCFSFDDSDTLLAAGEVEYAHLSESAWEPRLELLKAAGLNAAAIVVPWSHHQPAPGRPELSDLRAFLDLCATTGLLVQIDVGPFADERLPAGGVPGWVIEASAAGRAEALSQWLAAVGSVVAEYELAAGGPIAYVVVAPIPGEDEVKSLLDAAGMLRDAGVTAPIAAANVPGARGGARQELVNLLDTLSFYAPVDAAALAGRVRTLEQEERGPAVVSSLAGDYGTPAGARHSLDAARVALGCGATALSLSDFAPGVDPALLRSPGDWMDAGAMSAEGARTAGYGEVKLLGGLLREFGAELARAVAAEGVVEADDEAVRAAARFGEEQGFVFLWDEGEGQDRSVRLTYHEPGTEQDVMIPQAGTIHLPAGGAKVLPLDVPLGRGVLRYTTSEVAAMERLGERVLLVVYGDVDTPGEIALRLPGPPLVTGNVARQHWDPESKTLVLDYYHGATDHYVLVDEIQVAVLSRERAAAAARLAGDAGAIRLSAGTHVVAGSFSADGAVADVECPAGSLAVTAALPRRPSEVTLDGEPLAFEFGAPERVLRCTIETESFAETQRPGSIWERIGRAVVGGPPRTYANFDRGFFRPDAEGPRGECEAVGDLGGATEGPAPGGFARLYGEFEASGPVEIAISGSTYPTLVFVNSDFVPALSGDSPERRADISALTRSGTNEVKLVVHVVPRRAGRAGLQETLARLPEVRLIDSSGAAVEARWDLCRGLAGEAAGWAATGLEPRRWHFLRFGPWREQGPEPAQVRGVGWYRVSFALPEAEEWTVPYHLRLEVSGAGRVYVNGEPLAALQGEGEYLLPLPAAGLRAGGENVIALALYGESPRTGLHRLDVGSDESQTARRRRLEIRF